MILAMWGTTSPTQPMLPQDETQGRADHDRGNHPGEANGPENKGGTGQRRIQVPAVET